MTSTVTKFSTINDEYINSYPLIDTPVSYDSNGNIISRFGDDVWDFKNYIYSPNQKRFIYFNNIIPPETFKFKSEIIYEYKLIIYGLIYCKTNSSKNTSIQTILAEYSCFLRYIFKVAFDCNTTLNDLSSKPILINSLFEKISFLNKSQFNKLSSLLNKMSALSSVFTQHNFSLNPIQFKKLEKIKLLLDSKNYKQTLVIPTWIYLKLSSFLNIKLFEYAEYENHLLQLYTFKNKKGKNNILFQEYIKNNKLEVFCNLYKINSHRKLTEYFYNIVTLAQTQILLFSGMRLSECLLLPYESFTFHNFNNKPFYTFYGYTSKLTRFGPIRASWITTDQVKTAVSVLKNITKAYLNSININLSSTNLERVPLACFVHTKLSYDTNSTLYDFPITRKLDINNSLRAFNFEALIDEAAMRELEITTSNIDVNSYDLELGTNFFFNPHQFRRSLAVYTARSGLVKLPALKAQLKHISQDMTLYYANHSADTVNLFDSDLVESFQNEISIDQLMNFKNDVLKSIDDLYGGEGSRLQHAIANDKIPLFISDEKITLKNIKEGKMSYRRTPLGGCSKIGNCDEISELTITACISCKDAIFTKRTDKALKIALNNFEDQLKNYPVESPFRTHLQAEISQINNIINKRQSLQDKINGQ